jgi:tetratricopeptide (TPR) repeat protein
MLNAKKIIWILTLSIFSSMLYAQDEGLILGDDEQEKRAEGACVPEDLSVVYDNYIFKTDADLEVRKAYSFGREYHKNKNYKDAIPLLWKVFVNDSSKYASSAIGLIAECYFNVNKIDSTLIACYKGLERFPDNQKLHYYAGFLQNQLGRSACAIPHYESLVKKNPDNQSYLSTLAFLYFKEGDKRAIEVQKIVVAKFPEDGKAQEALANYMSFFGESAKAAWQQAWENDKTNFDAGRNYAKTAIDEGSYQEALAPLTTIIATGATALDYQLRSSAYENLGQNSKAIDDLNEWLKLDPDNADIMLTIAENYMYLKRYSTSNNWIGQALRKKAGYGKAYITRGELYEYMVSACQGSKTKLEDKLVYEEAIKVYYQAANDIAFKSQANTKINNLKPFIRTSEEIFMEPNVKVKNDCYEFLVGSTGIDKN